MGECYTIADRFEEWDTFDPTSCENPLFGVNEDDPYPDLAEARRQAAIDYPRAANAAVELASTIGMPDHFIGSDPTEMRLDISQDEFIDEFTRYKWVAGSQLTRLSMAMATNMMEVLQTWPEEDLEAFYEEMLVGDDGETDWNDFDEFFTMVHSFEESIGVQLMGDVFDDMVYGPTLPTEGETWVVYAPLVDRLLDEDAQYIGAIDLDDSVFEPLYRKAYVLQEATVEGFTPWWNDAGIDREMTALAHPRMRVTLDELDIQLVVGPQDALGPASQLGEVPPLSEREHRVYPGGVLPKTGEVWIVSLDDEYGEYAGGILPESALGGQTMRAAIQQNVDWKQVEDGLDDDLLPNADMLYHPWMAVELDDGTELTLPPSAFTTRAA